jgi:glycosyltransferase involved in cell wall biosynthesis
MKISVVTVCRNSERTIPFTIESWCRQTHPDRELVIVDGASTDGTLSVVGSFAADGIRVVSEPDRGLYDAMNKGLALFSGEAVGFLNSDDRFRDRDVLARLADALASADIVHGNLDFVADHQTGKVTRRWRGSPHRPGAFATGWMPAHPTFYIRRAVVDAVGRFDLRYRIAADYDYMLRAMELHRFRSIFLESVLVEMMAGGNSTAGIGAYLRSNVESLRSRRKWLGAGLIDAALFAKPLRKLPQFRRESFLA